jgi:hypothetical protein
MPLFSLKRVVWNGLTTRIGHRGLRAFRQNGLCEEIADSDVHQAGSQSFRFAGSLFSG